MTKCTDEGCGDRHCNCRRHVAWGDYTCPVCLGSIRVDMNRIEDACTWLPEEAEHRGVNSEAAYLAGPHTDPTRWQWRRINQMRAGLDADDWDMLHPGVAFAHWERELREDFGHDDVVLASATISAARGYLDTIVAVMARSEDHVLVLVELGKTMSDLRRYLERVRRDSNMGDRANVDCFDCGGDLEKRLTDKGFEDHWTCRACHRPYSDSEYNFALRAKLEDELAKQTGVAEAS